MKRYWKPGVLALALFGSGAMAQTDRGELLYETHCNSCHTEQLHWRDKSIAPDLTRLVHEVRRWQLNGNLDWSDDDIAEVARYLDRRFYQFPLPAK